MHVRVRDKDDDEFLRVKLCCLKSHFRCFLMHVKQADKVEVTSIVKGLREAVGEAAQPERSSPQKSARQGIKFQEDLGLLGARRVEKDLVNVDV